jgi:hypothetical protein
MSRRRTLVLSAGVVVAAGLTFGLVWFQPWKLVVDDTVDEALPAVATATVAPATGTSTTYLSSPATRSTPAASVDTVVSRGTFVSHEHSTRGTVSVVRRADGSRVLAIANLHTSNGPLLKVWLTDQAVTKDGWHVFDDGAHLNLGGLKGNIGNQVYRIPADADLDVLHSVTIWCDRFDVSFGAAELRPVTATG